MIPLLGRESPWHAQYQGNRLELPSTRGPLKATSDDTESELDTVISADGEEDDDVVSMFNPQH